MNAVQIPYDRRRAGLEFIDVAIRTRTTSGPPSDTVHPNTILRWYLCPTILASNLGTHGGGLHGLVGSGGFVKESEELLGSAKGPEKVLN